MDISIDDPKTRLADVIQQVDAGEAVTLLRDGRPLARVVPMEAQAGPADASRPRPWNPEEIERRRRVLLEISERSSRKATPGTDAAHSADYLYDEDGLPI